MNLRIMEGFDFSSLQDKQLKKLYPATWFINYFLGLIFLVLFCFVGFALGRFFI